MARRIYTDRVGLHIPAPVRSKPVWSLGTQVGGLVFTAGQPGVDASGAIVGGIAEQTRQAYENLRTILDEAGLGFSDVARVRIFVTRPEDYAAMTDVRVPFYREHFTDGRYPASTALVTQLAVPGLLVEIDAVAGASKRTFDSPALAKRVPLPLAAQPLWRHGAQTGDLLWTTGQPGFDLEARVAGPDVATQTRQSLANLEAIVVDGGFALSDVVALTAFVSDPADVGAMVAARDDFLASRLSAGAFPATTTVVAGFPVPEMRVEIEAIAARGEKRFVPRTAVAVGTEAGVTAGRGSRAVRAGDWVFVAGQAALDDAGRLVAPGDVRGQTARVFENLGSALAAAGAGWEHVVHFTVWLADAALYDEMTQARMPLYHELFPSGDFPASTAVVAGGSVERALVEIEAIAYVE